MTIWNDDGDIWVAKKKDKTAYMRLCNPSCSSCQRQNVGKTKLQMEKPMEASTVKPTDQLKDEQMFTQKHVQTDGQMGMAASYD